MVLTVIISAVFGAIQSLLLYFAISRALKNELKSAALFFLCKPAVYAAAIALLMTLAKDHIVPAAIGFGVCFTVLTFTIALVSSKKKTNRSE